MARTRNRNGPMCGDSVCVACSGGLVKSWSETNPKMPRCVDVGAKMPRCVDVGAKMPCCVDVGAKMPC
eukprot:scaffold246_cov97-Isochrysis_galbana.AAC.8